MMKKILLMAVMAFTFHLSPFTLQAQQMTLSDAATASVLTCDPGNDFYTTFGHSAIRITDTAQGLDLVYNYGTFDFNTPHFYWVFTRGRLDYQLSRTTFEDFIYEYSYEGREVREQPLTFEAGQVQNLFLLLETNYLPQYRHYHYDILRDNCATRVRDVVYSAWANDTLLQRAAPPTTYRRLLAARMRGNLEWWHLGVDLLLGLTADHRCSAPERMFLPAEMEAELAQCTTSGVWTAPFIVEPSHQLLPSQRTPLKASFPPLIVFSLLFAVIALLSSHSLSLFHSSTLPLFHSSTLPLLDRLLFIIAGLCGLFLLFMWFGTDHWCTNWNLNILWLSPLLILIAIRLERSPRWALWLQEAMFVAAALYVLLCGLSVAIIPLILTLMLRVALLLKRA